VLRRASFREQHPGVFHPEGTGYSLVELNYQVIFLRTADYLRDAGI
jgi:hypothetical protein